MAQLTLIADAASASASASAAAVVALPAGFSVRAPRVTDADGLGRLYFDCQVPGADLAGVAEGVAEIRAFFQGEFGEFWPGGSGVIEFDGRLVAALLAVHRAPWDDTPDCPFITDLFTEPAYRRHGLARALLARCFAEGRSLDRPRIALRADGDNSPAIRLYEGFGFRCYHG